MINPKNYSSFPYVLFTVIQNGKDEIIVNRQQCNAIRLKFIIAVKPCFYLSPTLGDLLPEIISRAAEQFLLGGLIYKPKIFLEEKAIQASSYVN